MKILWTIVAVALTAVPVIGLAVTFLNFRGGKRERDRTEKIRAQEERIRALHTRDAHATLGDRVFADSRAEWKVDDAHFEMLTKKAWVPAVPWTLDQIQVIWNDARRPRELTVEQSQRRAAVLENVAPDYHTLLKRDHPDIFPGELYRVVDIEESDSGLKIHFCPGNYFDYLDTSEILTYESQLQSERNKPVLSGAYRQSLKDPFTFENRVAGLGVCVLTVVRNADGPTFIMMRRSGGSITHNPNRLGVTPAGEFAPSDDTPVALSRDREIWYTIMREFAEEFGGVAEAASPTGVALNYDTEPFRGLIRAKEEGDLRLHVLGLALEPLTWKPNLLLVCVFESQALDEIFPRIATQGPEGMLHVGSGHGLPFDDATVTTHLNDSATTAIAKVCLSRAWKFREELGITSLP